MKSIGLLFTVYFDLSVANLYYTSTHLPAVGRSPPSLNKETRRIPIKMLHAHRCLTQITFLWKKRR